MLGNYCWDWEGTCLVMGTIMLPFSFLGHDFIFFFILVIVDLLLRMVLFALVLYMLKHL